MSASDRFSIFVIDDEEGPRTAVAGEAKSSFTISSLIPDNRLRDLGIQRDLVHVKAFRTQAEGAQAILQLKESERFTCFLLDADLSHDGQGGKVTGGLSLWRALMETVGEEHYEEFFATIYTKSPAVKDVLAPIFNFPSSRPVFLDFGKTKVEITRVKEHLPLMADHFKRASWSYALNGEFKAGPSYKHLSGEASVEVDGRDVRVRSILREDLRKLLSSPIRAEFWAELGTILCGKKYYLEVNEGRSFFGQGGSASPLSFHWRQKPLWRQCAEESPIKIRFELG